MKWDISAFIMVLSLILAIVLIANAICVMYEYVQHLPERVENVVTKP